MFENLQMKEKMRIEEGKFEEKLDKFHGYQPWYDGFEGNNHRGG